MKPNETEELEQNNVTHHVDGSISLALMNNYYTPSSQRNYE